MKTTWRRNSAYFKAKVALEAIRGDLTLAKLAPVTGEREIDKLHPKNRQLVVEQDFLAKAFDR